MGNNPPRMISQTKRDHLSRSTYHSNQDYNKNNKLIGSKVNKKVMNMKKGEFSRTTLQPQETSDKVYNLNQANPNLKTYIDSNLQSQISLQHKRVRSHSKQGGTPSNNGTQILLQNTLIRSRLSNHSQGRFKNTHISSSGKSNQDSQDSQSYGDLMLESRDRVANLDNSQVLQHYFKRGTIINKLAQNPVVGKTNDADNSIGSNPSTYTDNDHSSNTSLSTKNRRTTSRISKYFSFQGNDTSEGSSKSAETSQKQSDSSTFEEEQQNSILSFYANKFDGLQIDGLLGYTEYNFQKEPDYDLKENEEIDYAYQDSRGEYQISFIKQINETDCKPKSHSKKVSQFEAITIENTEVVEIKSKTDQQIRQNLMAKLAYNRIMTNVPQQKIQHQSVIIFDWDDTLMSSSFLSPFQSSIMTENIRKKLDQKVLAQLDNLEVHVTKLLKKSLKTGPTFIITNAGTGWVELSSMRFLPKLYKELIHNAHSKGLQIISARSMFEKELPSNLNLTIQFGIDEFKEWKVKAFLRLTEKMDQNKITNIVAIGDSQIEMDAANHLAEHFNEAYIKTVKLKEQPNIVELTKQVELINNTFNEIVHSAKNLTIRLQKVAPEQSENIQQLEKCEEQKDQAEVTQQKCN